MTADGFIPSRIALVEEWNEAGCLLYVDDARYTGAFLRGATREEALPKLPEELQRYGRWAGIPAPDRPVPDIVQSHHTALAVCDADSEVLFDSERLPLTEEEYARLREAVLRSAQDFLRMYRAVSQKDTAAGPPRQTFYGAVPSTARAMYEHTQNVNAYYFGEIGVEAQNGPDILTCRRQGLEALERQPDFLRAAVRIGSYEEAWSVRKVLRRFLWHDRIHAKALYRLAVRLGGTPIPDPFHWADPLI